MVDPGRVDSLGLVAIVAVTGCSPFVSFDGYGSRDRAGRPIAAFQSHRFIRGDSSFTVPAAEGLLRSAAAESRVVAGSFSTAARGTVALDAEGGFVFSPAGAAGAFWGDDYFEYALQGTPQALARVRLTVLPEALLLSEFAPSAGAAFGVGGAAAEDEVGRSAVDSAGDVNGDGLEDFVLGAVGPSRDFTDALIPLGPGRSAYVLFGKRDGASVSLQDLASEPPKGFAILGDGLEQSLDTFGYRVAGAGDVNGDGLDDVIVGDPAYDPAFSPGAETINTVGAAFVVFGKADARPVSSAEIRAGGAGGFAIQARGTGHGYLGVDVSGAGDVDGDGLDDVIVGVPILDLPASGGASATLVVYGKGGSAPVWLEDVAEQRGGFAILAGAEDPSLGQSVAGVGDVNGDGFDDVAVGSPQFSPSGRTALVFGKREMKSVLLTELEADPTLGYFITGSDELDRSGDPSAGGDVNGDGLDDVIIGAPFATLELPSDPPVPDGGVQAPPGVTQGPRYAERGVVYVAFGKREPGGISLRDLEDGSPLGFLIAGDQRYRRLGHTTSHGDVNADGLSDVIATTPPNSNPGEAYVVFGKRDTRGVLTNDGRLPAEVGIVIASDGDELGCEFTASGADANGDGIDDFIVSAPLYRAGPQAAGGAYVVFGWDMTGALAGRDRALRGSAGPDVLYLPSSEVVIVRGGNGRDTLRVGDRAAPLDLRVPGRYESVEVVDLTGAGPQQILLDDPALRRIPQNHAGFAFGLTRLLTVLGDAEDTLVFDATGFIEYGANAGRIVYGRPGVYYGLEISTAIQIARP